MPPRAVAYDVLATEYHSVLHRASTAVDQHSTCTAAALFSTSATASGWSKVCASTLCTARFETGMMNSTTTNQSTNLTLPLLQGCLICTQQLAVDAQHNTAVVAVPCLHSGVAHCYSLQPNDADPAAAQTLPSVCSSRSISLKGGWCCGINHSGSVRRDY